MPRLTMTRRRGHGSSAAGRGRGLLLAGAALVVAVPAVPAVLFVAGPAPAGPGRRQALAGLVAASPAALAGAGPAGAEEGFFSAPGSDQVIDESPRLALYRGKATTLRASAEWYRFFIGDLIERGSGATARDGLKSTDADCGGGLCDSAISLAKIDKLLPHSGQMGLNQIDNSFSTPMSTMADMAVWDPDTCDQAKEEAAAFRDSVVSLGDSIRKFPDGDKAQQLYKESLDRMNIFFQTANQALELRPEDDRFLPYLPTTQAALVSDEYWQDRRVAYTEAMDPVKEFQERNAFGSKELRKGLKRFPGATLLLR